MGAIGMGAVDVKRGRALAALPGCSQGAPPAAAPHGDARQQVDAEEKLRRMAATIGLAPGFAVRMTTERETRLPDGKVAPLAAATSAILVRRRNHMTAHVASDVGNFALWFDGQQPTLFNPGASTQVAASTPAPATATPASLADGTSPSTLPTGCSQTAAGDMTGYRS